MSHDVMGPGDGPGDVLLFFLLLVFLCLQLKANVVQLLLPLAAGQATSSTVWLEEVRRPSVRNHTGHRGGQEEVRRRSGGGQEEVRRSGGALSWLYHETHNDCVSSSSEMNGGSGLSGSEHC